MERPLRSPARIALLLESDGPGGAETLLIQLAEELRRRGHTVTPIGPAFGCGWLGGQFRQRGFTPEVFTLRRPIDFSCLAGMVRLLRRLRTDVLHSHEFTGAVYGTAATALLRVPHVITLHATRYPLAVRRRRVALRWAFRHSRRAVGVSQATREDLTRALNLGPDEVTVIHNGIRLVPGDRRAARAALGLPDDTIMILAVGNLRPGKGHLHLLQAAARLKPEVAALPWRVYIAGQGDREELESFARQAGIADRVCLLGHRDDIAALLAASDIYAMPSLWENLPMALLEAMFAGRAVVASGVGGIPEAVRDGVEGVLSPPGDPEGLARALEPLIADPALRQRLGAAAERRAHSEFGIEVMTDAYERAYGLGGGA
jgi:glycosyltransferase involved in cell wall biosynthesis